MKRDTYIQKNRISFAEKRSKGKKQINEEKCEMRKQKKCNNKNRSASLYYAAPYALHIEANRQ